MKFRSYVALSSCAVASALLTGCPSSQETSTETTETTTTTTAQPGARKAAPVGKQLKLAFVTNNPSDFWKIAEKGVEKAQKELPNVTVEFKIPAGGTAAEQKRIVDDLLATGVDGIAISPKDPANQVQMINAAAKKTLVVTQDSDAPNSNRTCYIGTDNRAAGRQAGEQIKAALPNGGKIMVFVGSLDAQNAKDRLEGIKDAIKGSKIVLAGTRTDETDRTKAVSNVSNTLVESPDVACLVGLWSYNGPSILSAVQKAGKVGKVKIVCFDEEENTLAGVKSGAIYATVVQQPFEFGYQSIRVMHDYLNGDKSVVPKSKQIVVRTEAIKKENVEEFSKKLKEMTA
ncbi:MAG: sugar-binding protein [Armatimonadota bacterium]|nr:sugar-binding protein [Armatimonadota bacterium]